MPGSRAAAAADAKRRKEIDKSMATKQSKLDCLRRQCMTIFLSIKELARLGRVEEVEHLKIELALLKEDVRNVKYDIQELTMERQYLQESIDAANSSKKKGKGKPGQFSEIELQVEKMLRKSEKSGDVDVQLEKLELEDAQMNDFREQISMTGRSGELGHKNKEDLAKLYTELCQELGIPIDKEWLRTAF